MSGTLTGKGRGSEGRRGDAEGIGGCAGRRGTASRGGRITSRSRTTMSSNGTTSRGAGKEATSGCKKRRVGGSLNKKTGYELTTVHHRPPKKMMVTSSKSPDKVEDSSKVGSSMKREGSKYYPLPGDCWVC